ncbi:MAG: T9SS C-terminal target domain-containing protein [Calditrichaeota bacterium]|nr:MAG: T9SS C-terminal target domain-containing protein [Calditrichota bacterium]
MGKILTLVLTLFIFSSLLFAQGPYYKPYIWKANAPITVDGVLDEWNYNFHWDHNQESMPETARCRSWFPESDVDKSGYLMLMWDEQYLYFAGSVMDDVPGVIPGPGWRADCFELYIGNWDIGPKKPWPDYVDGASKLWPDTDDGKWACQISLQWDAAEDTTEIFEFHTYNRSIESENTVMVGKLWDNSEGYFIEGKIDLTEIESRKGNVFAFQEGMHIPLATTLYDVDEYVEYDFDGYSASSGDHNPPSGIGPGYQSTELRGVRPDGAFVPTSQPYIQKAPGVVTLDGDLSDWGYAFNFDYNQTAFKETARCRGFWPDDNVDLSGRQMLMWDEEYLYFAADIRDDVPSVIVGTGTNGWRNDVMELYIGNYDQGDFDSVPHPGTAGYTTDTVDTLEMQISLAWDSVEDTVRIWNWGPLNQSLATENSTIAGKLWPGGDGYVYEGKLKLSDIADIDANGRTFNFVELLDGVIPFNASCWDVDEYVEYDFDGYIEDVAGAWGGPAHTNGDDWHGAKIVGKSIFAELDWLWVNYTGVEEKESVPSSFTLHQNYPNPFNPTTTITFDLSRDGKTSLAIYNARGEVVRNILNQEYRTLGAQSMTVDMSDLPSGVYLSVLEQHNVKQTVKMTLLK